MKKTLILAAGALAVAAAAPAARAQALPSSHEVPIAWGEKHTAWPVPALGNGALWSIQIGGITNGATVAVRHLVPFGGAGACFTNTVEAAAANGALYTYAPAPALTNSASASRPTLLVPGDRLLFSLSATNTSATAVIRTAVR